MKMPYLQLKTMKLDASLNLFVTRNFGKGVEAFQSSTESLEAALATLPFSPSDPPKDSHAAKTFISNS